VIREFSAGGPGRPQHARAPVRRDRAGQGRHGHALPKGNIEAGEKGAETARARGARGDRPRGRVVEKLGDIKYWYVRKWSDGERVFKVVSFFLLRYRSGSLENYQRAEVDGAEWIPLEDAPKVLAYRGEKDMAKLALSKLSESG
jgi:8-oxo-dGTP pyrophosphatase MutT (NUDIX family)